MQVVKNKQTLRRWISRFIRNFDCRMVVQYTSLPADVRDRPFAVSKLACKTLFRGPFIFVSEWKCDFFFFFRSSFICLAIFMKFPLKDPDRPVMLGYIPNYEWSYIWIFFNSQWSHDTITRLLRSILYKVWRSVMKFVLIELLDFIHCLNASKHFSLNVKKKRNLIFQKS